MSRNVRSKIMITVRNQVRFDLSRHITEIGAGVHTGVWGAVRERIEIQVSLKVWNKAWGKIL